MDKEQMFRMGEDHARASKMLTPYDCKDVDAMLFAEYRRLGLTGAASFRWYAEMRGAFNHGWESAYAEIVA